MHVFQPEELVWILHLTVDNHLLACCATAWLLLAAPLFSFSCPVRQIGLIRGGPAQRSIRGEIGLIGPTTFK